MGTVADKKKQKEYIDKARIAEDKYGIPPYLLVGMIKTESEFDPKAVSPAGAEGLLQFMPATSAAMKVDPYNVDQAIEGAAKYLKDSHKRLGNWEDTVLSYNMGVAGVKQYKSGKRKLLKEQAEYTGKVFGNRALYYNPPKKEELNLKERPTGATIDKTYVPKPKIVTNNLNNFDFTQNTPTFASVPDKQSVVDKDIEEVEQKTAEQNFLEEYSKMKQQPQQQYASQEEQLPLMTSDITGIYNNVSQFIETDVAQQGGKKQYPEFKKVVPKSEKERLEELLKERPRTVVRDNTAVVTRVEKGKQKTVNPNQQVKTNYVNERRTASQIIADRNAKIKESIKAQDEDIIGNPNWREVLARETQSTGDKFRLFPQEDSFIDNYLNPAVMVGDMASNLGQSPYQAEQQDSYMPYVTSVGTPLAVGALAGLGTNSTSQFANNLLNPLAGTGDLVKGAFNKGVNALENKGIRFSLPPESRQGLKQSGVNPLDLIDKVATLPDKVIPRPLNPQALYGSVKSGWNDLMPLNILPEGLYGEKLSAVSSYPNFIGFRKFGNSIDDVVESQSLRPNGRSEQIAGEGNWAETGKVNENYSGVFEATMNPQIDGSNIKLEKFGKRNGILGTTKEGDVAIPITDPGLSFNRRLPFSNRYVPINKDKLISGEFQLATQLPHVQSLAEKYGLYAGVVGGAGYVSGGEKGAVENINTLNKYTVKPIITGIEKGKQLIKEIKQQGGEEIIDDNMGQYNHPGKVTRISSPFITMKDVPYDILAIANNGEKRILKPNEEHYFKGAKTVTEYPILTEEEKRFLKEVYGQ